MSDALPGDRGGLLSSWYAAFAAGDVAQADVAQRAGEFDDHAVTADGDDISGLAARLRRDGVTSLELVIPVPGDVRGLPGPGALTAASLDAGEALLSRGGQRRIGLVPAVTLHGPAGDQTSVCTWVLLEVDQPELLAPPVLTVAEATADLRLALAESTRELARLDVARWTPEIAAPLTKLRADARRGRGATSALPFSHPAAARDLLAKAEPIARVLDLAERHDGTVLTGADVAGRGAALRALAAAVRRARMAAYNGHTGSPRTAEISPAAPERSRRH